MDPTLGWGIAAGVLLAALALLVALRWPRGRVTHRYGVFIAAPPKTVWDTYLVHINKADFRPATRLLDAEIVADEPLTVRVRLQHNIAPEPVDLVLTYEVYEPYSRYRLHGDDDDLVEEGTLTAQTGGTRLEVAVTGRMQGFVLPAMCRYRERRNQQALKNVCEGRPPPRAPVLPRHRWALWMLLVAAVWLFLPVSPDTKLVLALAATCLAAALLLWRAALARKR